MVVLVVLVVSMIVTMVVGLELVVVIVVVMKKVVMAPRAQSHRRSPDQKAPCQQCNDQVLEKVEGKRNCSPQVPVMEVI